MGTEETGMDGTAGTGVRIIGDLRSADGAGVVRIEDRYATDMEDLWMALTDPARLARWYGQVDGDLRPVGSSAPISRAATSRALAGWRPASRRGGCG